MRETYVARLERKQLLSTVAACYHLQFVFDGPAPELMEPGQFLSLLAEDAAGKTYTRAYSIASAPRGASFDVCLNRVEGGFFSNLLCNMAEGESVRCHGPHGLFTLKPGADGLLIAASTGIAPMRGFLQWLFPEGAPDRSGGREYWLIYEAPNQAEFFYSSYFEQLALNHANFHYLPVSGSDGDHRQMLRELAQIAATKEPNPTTADNLLTQSPEFGSYAYLCGLNEIVKAARAELLALGWEKRQILFERYD